ncbi:MAG: DUF2256 domain-containing protein [Bacteroidota bacterium]|nr:DUF2256 domain-containing protein [Bacteroidota bacterium]
MNRAVQTCIICHRPFSCRKKWEMLCEEVIPLILKRPCRPKEFTIIKSKGTVLYKYIGLGRIYAKCF